MLVGIKRIIICIVYYIIHRYCNEIYILILKYKILKKERERDRENIIEGYNNRECNKKYALSISCYCAIHKSNVYTSM